MLHQRIRHTEAFTPKMELQQVILARLVRTFNSKGTFGYLPDLVEKIKRQYGFLSTPMPEQLLPTSESGAEFQHGRLQIGEKSRVIDKLVVYRDGIVIDTSSSTDDCEVILTDLLRWAEQNSITIEHTAAPLYVSQLVVKMDIDFERLAPVSRNVSKTMTTFLTCYGLEVPEYNLDSIRWNFDQTRPSRLKPSPFLIENRADVPHGENVYFSQAPLKTRDHLHMIESIQQWV
jgi:hypothetical protein